MAFEFSLNGRTVRVEDADPQLSLLQWLRQQRLTGAKEGCAEGECGACAVAWFEPDASGGSALQAVNSCLVPLAAVAGRALLSVEGVAGADGALHPVQQALVEAGASQCGYCTPGFAISLFCEYYRRGRRGYDPEAISGNLCRCTGYRPIVEVAKNLPQPAVGDPLLSRLAEVPPARASFEHQGSGRRYFRPADLQEALEAAAHDPAACFIAGGTDSMVLANLRGRRDASLIALDGIAELNAWQLEPAELRIGAALPLSVLERRLAADSTFASSALAQLWPLFSSRLIRNRATLGGNLATASPIGDAAPVLLALDASLTLASVRGRRRIGLRDFFTGYRSTALQRGELIASVHIPLPMLPLQRFYKVSKRKLDDISTVAAAFCLQLDEAHCVQQLRVAYGGIAATPLRALAFEDRVRGQPWTADTARALRHELEQVGTPIGDLRGSAAYRRAMIGNLFEKFQFESAALAQAAP